MSNFSWVWLRSVLLLGLAVCVACDCGTKVSDFRVIIGAANPQIHELQGASVYICPGESVTLGWSVENADSASIDNGVGSVAVPSGTRTVNPAMTTHYTLKASRGKCDNSASVDVYVITQLTPVSVTAQLIQRGPFVWEAKLLPAFYSPNLHTASAELSSPPTQAGWRVHNIDFTGAIHDFGINSGGFLSVGAMPIPVAGTYDLSPIDQSEVNTDSPPGTVSFILNMTCK